MDLLKGMMLGIIVGMTAGVTLGTCKSNDIMQLVKEGKKEMKRFKRKYM